MDQLKLAAGDRVVVILSGRGDKDMTTYLQAFGDSIGD